jgi:NAD(P)-dependent dehydrogenase (short-subunit alcohol dehydrogenase family)
MVAFLAPKRDELNGAAVEAVSLGATAALGLPCDVSNPEELAAATERIEQELGPVDVWFDAGIDTHHAARWKRALVIGISAVGVAAVSAIAWRAWRASRC